MNSSIHTHNMTSIHSHERAAKMWDAAESFPKSVHTSWKPLDGRRQEHKRLVKLSDDRGYECVLYKTAMVTYFADGLVALRCHDSVSSRDFSYRVAPTGCGVTSHKGRMYWEVKTDEGTRYYRESTYPLMLAPTAKGNWLLTSTPVTDYETVYDRKLGAQVQNQLRPYAAWHKVAVRMGVETMPPGYIYQGHVVEAEPYLNNVEYYPAISRNLGAPENFREHLYLHAGAKYKTPVSHGRLPRN